MYSALDIAKYIVSYCLKKGNPVSNLKLQKLLYFLWVEYYKTTGKPLFLDKMYAWKLGPVVPEVYYQYCSYAGIPIFMDEYITIEKNDERVVNSILDRLLPYTAAALVTKTHLQGTPWYVVYSKGSGERCEIPFYLIEQLEINNAERR